MNEIKAATVLIVDDLPYGREVLEGLLADRGYQLALAESGQEALTKAAQITPDIVLLDVMMPGMDGFEVCRRLRADPVLAEIPVVMVTALDDAQSRLQGIEAGADDFITKPFDRVELRARVHSIVRLNRYRRLHSERQRFAWVVEHADDGYLMVNASGEVIYANAKARLYLGIPDGAVIPHSFLELAQRRYRCEPEELWKSWSQSSIGPSPRVPRYLVQPETDSAQAFWLQVDILQLQTDDQRLIRLRDVTAEVNAQRGVRSFQATIAHKLRTPMSQLLGSLGLMAEMAASLSPAEITMMAAASLKGARRLHDSIEDILQYVNSPNLASPQDRLAVNQIPELVAEVCREMELQPPRIAFEDKLSDKQLILPGRTFELILREILENAKKFHPAKNPQVEVTLALSSMDRLQLLFSDDGLTLTPDQLAQVWKPYYQGEKYFTGEVAGMGLGLATVAALVWPVQGSCRLYNRDQGPGVVVELNIPISRVAAGG